MPLAKLLILGAVIGSNNLAASLALGALGQSHRRWRIIPVFGTFEFMIPLLGMWAGRQASGAITARAGWLGVALLGGLGIWAILGAIREQPHDESFAERVTTWRGLILLAAGLSVDNLLVGFSLGLRNTPPWIVAATICVFSMSFAWLGLQLGDHARRHWERRAKFGAGSVLLTLALATHLEWI